MSGFTAISACRKGGRYERSHFRLVNEAVRSNVLAAVRTAEIGGDSVLVVSIEPEAKRRTQRQNRYLWGVVYKTIADNDPGFFGNESTVAALHASAAFARLCVETISRGKGCAMRLSAAFARLCVETARRAIGRR